jgi:hypothetical protein
MTKEITIDEVKRLYDRLTPKDFVLREIISRGVKYYTVMHDNGSVALVDNCYDEFGFIPEKSVAEFIEASPAIAALAIRQAEELEQAHKENSRLVLEKRALREALVKVKIDQVSPDQELVNCVQQMMKIGRKENDTAGK